MAAVVKVIETVVDVVADVVGTVVDVVVDAVDWVVDEIVEPVVKGVGDIIQGVMDDPITAIAKAVAFVYAPWAIPLIDGASVLAKGGSFDDALKSAAISYATGKVADFSATNINPAIAKAGYGSTVTKALQKGIEGGIKSSTVALVYGQDPLKAFATGGINAAVGATLGQIADKIDTKFENLTGEFDLEDNPLVGGWEDLQDGVKDSVVASLTAELTGGEVSAEQLTGIIGKYTGVTESMSKFLSKNTGLDDARVEVLTSALTSAATTALLGNPDMTSEAFFAKIDEYGIKELEAIVDKPVDKYLDKISGTSAKTTTAANALNAAMQSAATAAEGYNGVREELNGKVGEQTRLEGLFDAALATHEAAPTQATYDAANAAKKTFEDYSANLTTQYNDTYKPQMDAYLTDYNKYEPTIEGLQKEYEEQSQYLMSDIDDLDAAMKPIYAGMDKAVALTLRPGIDEDSYRKLNGLEEGADVYQHYLANQKTAQVFDVEQLNAEAKAADADLYGEGYTVEPIITTILSDDGSTYDEIGYEYYVDTPDGKKKIDPYLEGIGGGRGGDPRDFNDGVWTMQDYRQEVADPVALGGRLTYDMASAAGDASRQGQIITLNDFKKLKDAGYKITAFKDKFTGETINGNQSYDDVLANHMQERARMGSNYKKPESTGSAIDFMGYTEVTEDIHKDVIDFWKTQGEDDASARRLANETAPIGTMLDGGKFAGNVSDFKNYIMDLEVPYNDGDPGEKYGFNENYEEIMIAEALRVGETGAVDDFFTNTAGLGLDAIGQLAQTFSYATILTNAAGLTDTAAQDTWLAKFGETLSETGKGIQTDEYKAKVKKLNEDMATAMSEAEGVGGTFSAVMGVAWENPGAFMSEYIVSELFQELPLLFLSGGTSLVAKVGLKGGAYALGTEFAEQTLKRAGVYTAVGTAVVTNVGEAFGGAAQDGYEKGIATYNDVTFKNLIKQGLAVGEAKAVIESPAHLEKAGAYATDLAQMAGLVGAGIALVTAGIGTKVGVLDNLALEKALFGKEGKAPAGFINQLKKYATTITAESLGEAVEEGGAAAFVEGRLSLIDPTRDVSGNITMAALLGTMSSAGTTGGILVGNEILNVGGKAAAFITTASPETLQKVGIGKFTGPTYDETGIDVPAAKYTPSAVEIESALKEAGIDDTDTQLFFKDYNYDADFTTKDELETAIQLEINNPSFTFTDDTTADLYSKFVGAKADSDLATEVAAYVDPLYTSYAEARDAALKEGVTLTDEQLDDLVGKPEDEVDDTIVEEYGPDHTSRAEAEQFFADLGYTPSEQEILDRVGAVPDADQKAAIKEYVNPRQVTDAESRAFFEATGYVGTNEEILARVGQGDDNFATKTEADIGAYVDPRMVSDAEARQFFADLGYENPTDEQVAQFVAQVSETEQAGVVASYVDPRQVTRDEVQAIADEEGLTLTDALAAAYVGQGVAENFAAEKLAGARTEYDPLATTEAEAADFFAATDYTATPEEIANFVASKTEEVQKSAIGGYVDPRQMTAEEAKAFLSEIGYNPTDEEVAQFTGQLNDATYQTTQKVAIDEYVDPRYVDAGEIRAAYEELGLVDVADADVDRFVGQFDEETQLEAVREYAPVATTNIIRGIIGSPSVEDDPNTDVDESKDATGIYKELEAGATRDEALEAALAKLTTDLGLTEAELLKEIGITKDELSDEIDVVAKDVTEVKEDVTKVKEDVGEVKEDVGDLTEVIGEAGVEDDPTTELTDESKDPTGLFATIKAYEDAGLDRDTALQKAIDDVSTALGTSKTDLLAAIGETETTLTEEIEGVETALTGDITALGVDLDAVAELVGKPAREVTQTDIDFVTDLIAGGNVTDELALQYDVTGDGIVDILDQNLLTDTLQGTTDTTLADTSMFDPATGLFLQQEKDTQTQLDAITDMNTEINTNINTTAKQQNFAELQKRLAESGDAAGQQVTVTPGEKVQLDYQYDIGGDSIFATEGQAGLFSSPFGGNRVASRPEATSQFPRRSGNFAQGGQVEDENDRLLRLLGEM